MNLFTFIRTKCCTTKLFRTGILLLLPFWSYSQTFIGTAASHNDNASYTGNAATIVPPGSMQAGDLVVVYIQYRYTSGTLSLSNDGGQTWTEETQSNGTNLRTRIIWCTFNGTWSANPVATRSGTNAQPLTATMYVYRPVSSNVWGSHLGPNGNTPGTNNTVAITGLTNTVPNTVTMAFWSSQDDNTWGGATGWTTPGSAQYRNAGGNQQSLTAAYIIQTAAGATGNASKNQTANGPDVTRTNIMSWYEIPPPSNDDCSAAIPISSAATCVNTAGTLLGATYTAVAGACGASSGNRNDVWYSFVATRTSAYISLSSAPAQSSLQLYSGTCGSLTSVQCSVNSTTMAPSGLTVGNTYYIRVWSDNNTAGTFNICIVDPPANDECSNAVNLAVMNTCSNIPGIMSFATPSSIPLGGSCTGPLGSDVWYKFTAVNNTATVTLGSVSGITGARMEVLTGTCSGFSTIACGVSPLNLAGLLTAGTTYYVRVYNTGAIPTSGTFNICVSSSLLPSVRYGNSYVNISKKTMGGVVQPGDTLEIRMTINHTSGTMYFLRYVDNIPSNTSMLAGTNDSIRVITNEGLMFRKYTPGAGDDAASYVASPGPGEYNIRMNLGFGTFPPGTPTNNTATHTGGAVGRMTANTDRPRGGGGMLFATAYRVVVSGAVGDTITINPGRFLYKTTNVAGDPDVTLTATSFKILISDPMDLCANSIGLNNAAELGGTFGSGTTLNRLFDLTVPIPGYSFLNNVSATNGLGDGRYAIVKNISPRSSPNRNANHIPNCGSLPAGDPNNCNNRMHGGHWDIDGDHTGTNDAIGNIPPDETTPGGYMLMVNADYVASEVFSQTLNNLCPNTYYEFSAWFRNICSTCGMDSTGAQFTNPPTAPAAGYVGVYPNLSFALNGLDYYSTGEIDLGGWQKKGFVFRTGPDQVSATFSIRNNSQGGGGNDWVMDDIAVATCLPTMSYSPTINPNVCQANAIVIADTVSSYFNNYTTYKWQRSANGGVNWTDITGVTTLPDTNYYITTYTVAPEQTTLSDSGTLYRVVVATTPDNLSDPNCNISDGVTITLHVLNCEPVLDVEMIAFNGILESTKARLSWKTADEDAPVTFIVERSNDSRNFSKAGELQSYNNGSTSNTYSFADPVSVHDKVWYRIAMVGINGKKKYSSTIRLFNNTPDFELTNLVNPFSSRLNFDISVATGTSITSELVDMAGRTVLSNKQLVYAGTNNINLTGTQTLPAGIYTLRVSSKDKFIIKRVVKN